MTKKDYELIADGIFLELMAVAKMFKEGNYTSKECDDRRQAVYNVGYRLNGLLANNDPKFNEFKFKEIWE